MPQFQNVGETNGAYLAYKIQKMLRSAPSGIPAEVIVLCPDESGATAITDCLDSTFNMTIIRVPKDVLGLARNHPITFRTLLEARYINQAVPMWLTQLRSLERMRLDLADMKLAFDDRDIKVIAMDEINVSGETRESILALATAFGLTILCYLSVIDYCPDSASVSAPSFALYKIDIQQTKKWGDDATVEGTAGYSM